jgi:hypothetical protein
VEKIFLKMMNQLSKDYVSYYYKEHIWLINPNTREWIISYYFKTKYAFWKYEFFKNAYYIISMDIEDIQPIKNWIELHLNVEVGNHCVPDMLPGDYDWSSDFNVDDVMLNGKVFLGV